MVFKMAKQLCKLETKLEELNKKAYENHDLATKASVGARNIKMGDEPMNERIQSVLDDLEALEQLSCEIIDQIATSRAVLNELVSDDPIPF